MNPLGTMNVSEDSYIAHIYDPGTESDFTPRLIWTGAANPHDKFRELVYHDQLDLGGYAVGTIIVNPFGPRFPTFHIWTLDQERGVFVILKGLRMPRADAPRIVNWPPK